MKWRDLSDPTLWFLEISNTTRVCSSDKMTPIYFLRLSKVWSMLHHGSVWLIHKKMLLNTFMYFSGIFRCFSSQNLSFCHFHFFSWWSIRFPQQNFNQSVTWIGGFQLSAELYANWIFNSDLYFIATSWNISIKRHVLKQSYLFAIVFFRHFRSK